MRHRKAGLKLNRTASHRNAMFRNMVTSLLKHDRIRTTGARAMEVRRWADHLITLAKRGDLHARRQALSIVREKDVVHKLFEQADERFGAVSGGYTRVIKLGKRPGDAASMSMVELIALEGTKKKKKAKKKKTKSEGMQKKEAVDQKAPAAAKAAKADEKEKASEKTKDETTDKKEAAEVEAKTKKPTVKGAAAKTSDEPSKVKTDSAKVKPEAAKAKPESAKAKAEPTEGDTKEEKPAKKTNAAPKKPAVTVEKKDAPDADAATKKAAAKKTPKDEK
jgi:large subunit ribosomal protein L17